VNVPHIGVRDFHHSLFFCNADGVKDDRITDVRLRVHSSQIQKRDAREVEAQRNGVTEQEVAPL